MIKAVGLFSGGLDSVLAAKLVSTLGIEVHQVGERLYASANEFSQGHTGVIAESGGLDLRI